jgi:hypothetical protein
MRPTIRNDREMRAISREITALKAEKAGWNRTVKAAERKEDRAMLKIVTAAKAELVQRQERATATRATLAAGRDREIPMKDRFAAAEQELAEAFREVAREAEAELARRQQRAGPAREALQAQDRQDREQRRERDRDQGLER